jgi:hypothetical protein
VPTLLPYRLMIRPNSSGGSAPIRAHMHTRGIYYVERRDGFRTAGQCTIIWAGIGTQHRRRECAGVARECGRGYHSGLVNIRAIIPTSPRLTQTQQVGRGPSVGGWTPARCAWQRIAEKERSMVSTTPPTKPMRPGQLLAEAEARRRGAGRPPTEAAPWGEAQRLLFATRSISSFFLMA